MPNKVTIEGDNKRSRNKVLRQCGKQNLELHTFNKKKNNQEEKEKWNFLGSKQN